MSLSIVALLTVRNESPYISTCLQHLISQGVDICLIDNESTDNTVALAEPFLGKGLLCIEKIPYRGCFELAEILRNEERLAKKLDADWYIHHDADEIRYAPKSMGSLKEAIAQVDKEGYNAINFDEFVFLPMEDTCDYKLGNYEQTLKHYYHFFPRKNHRINAWKNFSVKIDLVAEGGHRIIFEGRKIYPENFILKHYIGLGRRQLIRKYAGRVFSVEEMFTRGWHEARATFSATEIRWPEVSNLLVADDPQSLDTSDPQATHPFLNDDDARPISNARLLLEKKNQLKSEMTRMSEAMVRAKAKNNPRPVPFVVGVMRSGTTLLRLMLDAHYDLAIPSETRFFPALTPLFEREQVSPSELLDVLTSINTWPDFEINREQLQLEMEAAGIASAADGLRFFYSSYAKRFNKQRWGDKTPYYGLHLDQISTLFPEARFVHIIRDGRDVALSTKGLWFDLGNNIEEVAANWVSRIRQTRQLAQLVPHYLEIRYEDLVSQPEAVLKRVCRFLHLPFDASMLNYHVEANLRLNEFKPRYAADGGLVLTQARRKEAFLLTNEPPQTNRVARWRKECTTEEVKIFEEIAGDLLRELDYPMLTDEQS